MFVSEGFLFARKKRKNLTTWKSGLLWGIVGTKGEAAVNKVVNKNPQTAILNRRER